MNKRIETLPQIYETKLPFSRLDDSGELPIRGLSRARTQISVYDSSGLLCVYVLERADAEGYGEYKFFYRIVDGTKYLVDSLEEKQALLQIGKREYRFNGVIV
ncbi:MAG: hypothetical protein LBM38_02245 [Clostridiales bacterium]|jgi:hypothetical protein|nr:hypothetical protein [Clostridiales bacterium]